MNQALKNNPLLAQLKATLVEEKCRVIGEVLPSRKTFGFLLDEQGNRHFLAPPMMEKLLPGDRVEAVIETQDERENAVVEKIISSALNELYGVVRIRNGVVFMQPESDLLRSWMKLTNVKDLDEGDWVKATLIEHPFVKGKAKARVTSLVAKGGDKSMPWNLAIDRYGILPEPVWTPTEVLTDDHYADMTDLAFVTIDGESTMDVDDGLYAEKVDSGFKLWIAIADPSSYVMPGSMLDEAAMARGVTTYLPGETHPMLPRELSEKAVSLLENVDRPALVCEVFVDLAGDVSNVTFKMANIRSKAKLSYNLVNDYLSGHCNLNRPEEVSRTVAVLAECAHLLRTVRKQDAVLGDFGDDIRFLVQGHDLNGFKREARHEAHFLVEECMIVGNRAFAAYAHAHQLPCIYRSQKGYAPEDYSKVTEILQYWGLVEDAPDLSDLETFVRISQLLTLPEYFVPNVLLRGYMEKGQYSLTPNPHMGLGLSLYATFTSPIRKYSDLINHRIMKAHLRGEPLPVVEENAVSRIDSQNVLANKAAREVQKRLYARHYHWNNGEAEEGRIIQIRKDSIRVESLATGAYVSIPMKELAGDQQAIQLSAFDSEMWIDGIIQYRIGDVIRFGVNKVNPITANLDGVLAPPQASVA